jgi:hypothetical protein
VSCLSAGDTLIVKAGTYVENTIYTMPSGTANSPTTIKSEVQYGAVLKPDGPVSLSGNATQIVISGKTYITFDGFVVDFTNWFGACLGVSIDTGSQEITVQNFDIKNCLHPSYMGAAGIYSGQNTTPITGHNYIRNNKIHDLTLAPNAPDAVGLYITGNNNIIEGNEIYNVGGDGSEQWLSAGAGMSPPDNNIYRNNYYHDNGWNGLLLSSGTDNLVYNNIFFNNGRASGGHGIRLASSGMNNITPLIANNTIVGNGNACIGIDDSGHTPGATIRNNICWRNGTNLVAGDTSGAVIDHNLFEVDPLFVNTAGHDFHLQSTSPAIDAGIVVLPGQQYNGSTPDLGVFEFGTGRQIPAPTKLRLTGN